MEKENGEKGSVCSRTSNTESQQNLESVDANSVNNDDCEPEIPKIQETDYQHCESGVTTDNEDNQERVSVSGSALQV